MLALTLLHVSFKKFKYIFIIRKMTLRTANVLVMVCFGSTWHLLVEFFKSIYKFKNVT